MQSKNLLLAVMGILSQSSAFVVGPSVRQTTHLGVATPPVPPPMDESQLFFVEGLWNVEEGSDNTESKQFSEVSPRGRMLFSGYIGCPRFVQAHILIFYSLSVIPANSQLLGNGQFSTRLEFD
jgi:hypothetical protein